MKLLTKIQALWVRVTMDKRQFGVLCTLVLLGLLLWARLMIATDLPKMAIADPEATANAAEAEPDKLHRDERTIALEMMPARDPFIIDERVFPIPSDDEPDLADAGKSDSEPAEEPEQVESRLLEQVRSVVDSMRLEACMPSAGLAVIDGARYRVGDEIGMQISMQRLVVAEVRQRSVVLDADGRRFELKMRISGG